MKLKVEINRREHFALYGFARVPFAVSSRWFEGKAISHLQPIPGSWSGNQVAFQPAAVQDTPGTTSTDAGFDTQYAALNPYRYKYL